MYLKSVGGSGLSASHVGSQRALTIHFLSLPMERGDESQKKRQKFTSRLTLESSVSRVCVCVACCFSSDTHSFAGCSEILFLTLLLILKLILRLRLALHGALASMTLWGLVVSSGFYGQRARRQHGNVTPQYPTDSDDSSSVACWIVLMMKPRLYIKL